MDKENVLEKGSMSPQALLYLRLGAAVLLTAGGIVLRPGIVGTLLCVAAIGVSGYDLFIRAASSFTDKDYFAAPVLVSFAAVVSVLIGLAPDGALMLILYRVGLLLADFAVKKSRRSALELLSAGDSSFSKQLEQVINDEEATALDFGLSVEKSADTILKAAMGFALVFAVAAPIFTNMSYAVSIHRALIILVIAAPASVVAAMPVLAAYSLCFSAGQGMIPDTAAQLEKLHSVKTAVFDKAGVFSEDMPRVLSIEPELIDERTFILFAAHAAFYSEQAFSRAVTSLYEQDFRLDAIGSFTDIPGVGLETVVAGRKVELAKRSYFEEKGIELPDEFRDENKKVYYMTVMDRYVGRITVSDEKNRDTEHIVSELKDAGIEYCVLLSGDSEEESTVFAEEYGFDRSFGSCSTGKKLSVLEDLSGQSDGVMFVCSEGLAVHSPADVDIKVGHKARTADILVMPEKVAVIPFGVQVSRRMNELAALNAAFAFIVKALLIFLAITGNCTLWFAVFLDASAALATILHSVRVTKPSVQSVLRYKIG